MQTSARFKGRHPDKITAHEERMVCVRSSVTAVLRVASEFIQEGMDSTIKGVRYAPTYEDRNKFKDEGDIIVQWHDGIWRRVEVKRIRRRFTVKSGFPYPKLLICDKASYDRSAKSDMPPFAYVHVSSCLDFYSILFCDTRPLWTVEPNRDPREGRVQTPAYWCSSKLATVKPFMHLLTEEELGKIFGEAV